MAKPKNPAAVSLGRKGGKARAENVSADRLSEIGRQGAAARMASTTPEQRKAIAAKAGAARGKKKRK